MSELEYIDIHAHLNFPDFDSDRDQIIGQLADQKIGAINIGTDVATSRQTVLLAEERSHLWSVVGIHPHEALKEHDFDELSSLAPGAKVVAIGECGLDYFKLTDPSIKQKQKNLFVRQIELALAVKKPLMLHIRDSYNDILDILNAYPTVRTHAHFFSGDWALAKKFIDRGDTISFTGVITFTSQYDEVIQKVPADRLLAETDCPFVAPAPFRGERNDPSRVPLVVKKLAAIRGEDEELVRRTLLANAVRTFRL